MNIQKSLLYLKYQSIYIVKRSYYSISCCRTMYALTVSAKEEQQLTKQYKSDEDMNAIIFLKLSRAISFDIYKRIISHLNKKTHYYICCTEFDKYYCVKSFISKYFSSNTDCYVLLFNIDFNVTNSNVLHD